MTADPFPGETDPPAPSPRRWPRRLALAALAVLAFFGPWPVDNTTYRGSAYEARTLDRLASRPKPSAPGPIRVGVAEVDLTPPGPVPLAGFSVQAGRPFGAIDTRCFARALTVASGPRATTIVTADLLLINAELARLVIDRAGLTVEDLYFTSSHTHGGPGSWGRHPLERLVAGKFDPAVLQMLADRIGDAVRRSRADLVPAEVAMVQAHPAGRQKNRVVPGAPTHDALSALVFRPLGAKDGTPPLAILSVFGAHATVVRADPPRLSADYPGALVARVKERTGAGMVLFAAGAVGDAAPISPKIPSSPKAAQALGSTLADDLLAALPSARFSANVVVDHLRLAVDLPPMRLSFFSPWLRFSPAATWWIADQTTHLDALRIGPAILLGFPGDEAGHLAQKVVDAAGSRGPTPIVTSFNGDYRGYFESSALYFNRSCYETRWMNFYGPWLGEYLGEIGSAMDGHLRGDASPGYAEPANVDSLLQILLAITSAGTIVAMVSRGKRRSEPRPARARAALAVAAGFAVGLILTPDRMDWTRVGIFFDPMISAAILSWMAVVILDLGGKIPGRLADALLISSLAVQAMCWPIFLALGLYLLSMPAARPISSAHQS